MSGDRREWDGTAAGATPIIDWLLGLGITASYGLREEQGPSIRIDVPAPDMTRHLFARGSVSVVDGYVVVINE